MRKHPRSLAQFMAIAGTVLALAPLSITCEAQNGTAQIRLVGTITDWNNSADQFEQKVDALVQAGVTNAHVYIRTRGGDVFEANEIVNIIKRFKGTVTGGGGAQVASAGTMVAMNIADFKMASNGIFMYHKPYARIEGNEDQVKSMLKLLGDLTNQYRTLYATKTGLSEEEVEKRWSKSDVYLTAKEAMEQGFITGITDAEELSEEEVAQMAAMGAPESKLKIAALAAPTKQEPTMDIKALRVQLGMPESATEQEVLAKVKQLQDNVTASATAAANARTAEVKALLDKAVTDKRITEAHRKGFETMFAADFDATKAQLEAITPVITMGDATAPAAAGAAAAVAKGREAWTYDEWATKDEKGLNAMMKAQPDAFTALYEAKYGVKPELPKA